MIFKKAKILRRNGRKIFVGCWIWKNAKTIRYFEAGVILQKKEAIVFFPRKNYKFFGCLGYIHLCCPLREYKKKLWSVVRTEDRFVSQR